MKKLIVRLIEWFTARLILFLRWIDPPVYAASKPDPVFERVKTLVSEMEFLQVSGEYKRHTVYSRLLKDFPLIEKSRLSLLIELALQEYKNDALRPS